MKKYLVSFLILLPYIIYGQVVISYIQPDIVAPGMNSYIEFIAPHKAYNNFGPDQTYYNKPNDFIKIEVVNPADRWKVAFGPIVVSWQGRLISTQVFAHPSLKPNSWDWSQLNSEFKIKIRVNKGGQLSNEVDLYIVQPFPFGDRRASSERIIGQGSLGKRSPRGAMIVDRMILADDKYTVSTNDCDPNTPGNQGYLPFILISQGPIVGGTNTMISVDGGTAGGQARLQDGGPGGGGGGGRFYDAGLCDNTRNGDDGGDGFVGGGPGGRNNSSIPGVTSVMKLPGTGTFEDPSKIPSRGYSLNGIPPSYIPNVFESAGGGTGHPFGKSGEHCNDGNNCNPIGGLGGGSGVSQNRPGGSGGNATDGMGVNNSGGKAIGNRMIVPLSGGSGGASGNPQSGCNFSGSGGGGGGAIMIYAPEIRNVKISAKGANGQDGVGSSNGGGGSGGAIITSAKIIVDNGSSQSIFIEGGKAGGNTIQFGGWGRVRRDAPTWNVNIGNAASIIETYYQGPTTDTVKFIKPLVPFYITGTKKFEDSLQLWLKPESRDWVQVGTIPQGQSFWEIQMLLDRTDTVYYFIAMQAVPNAEKIDTTKAEPEFLLTQAAANVLLLEKIPEFYCIDTLFVDTLLACQGQQVQFKAKIYNRGDADLILNKANFAKGFLITNINNLTIKPFDSTEIIITYIYNKNHPIQIIDTLFIEHNDFWTGAKRPFPIVFKIHLKEIITYTNLHYFTIPYREINQTNVKLYRFNACLGENYRILASLGNLTDSIINLESIITSSNNITVSIIGDKRITKLDTCSYLINLIAANEGVTRYKLFYKILECDNFIDSLEIELITTRPNLEFVDNGDFPDTRVGNSTEKTIRLKNTGTAKIYINSITITGNDFRLISTTPTLPDTLLPNGEIQLRVRFAPLAQGENLSGRIFVNTIASENTCKFNVELPLKGTGISTNVLLSKYIIDFDTLYECASAYDTIYVINPQTATARFRITKPAEIIGSTAFKIHRQPNTPIGLAPGDSVQYIIRFEQGYAGVHIAELIIYTDETGYEEVRAQIKGVKDTLNVSVSPNPIDLGDVAVGNTLNVSFSITNNGLLPINLANIRFENQQLEGGFTPTTAFLQHGATVNIDMTLKITKNIRNKEPIWIDFQECQWRTNDTIVLNKLFASVKTNDPIDFGIVSGCEDTVKTAIVINTGQAAFVLKSWEIKGQDRDLFHFRGQSHTLPLNLQPNKDFQIVISFEPLASVNGAKQAYIEFDAEVNGEDTIIVINLVGEKRSTAIAIPDRINFGGKVIQTTSQLNFNLKNEGLFPLTIKSIVFPKIYPAEFTVLPDYTGRTLNAGEEITFTVSFRPTQTIVYIDTLVINTSYKNCDEKVYVSLEGMGLPPRILTLRLPNLELIDPRERNFAIPVFAKVENDTLVNLKIDTVEIQFNRSLYYPKSMTNGKILYQNVLNNDRILGFEISNINISDTNREVKVAEIIGDVMLGNDTATIIKINYISNADSLRINEIHKVDGSLSIKVCSEGGNRLLEEHNQPVTIVVNPMPISENAKIELNLLEMGYHRIDLYDLQGNLISEVDNFIIKGNDDKTKYINLNTNKLAGGVYLLKLTTPSDYKTALIIVVK